jgi:hypothetical protein
MERDRERYREKDREIQRKKERERDMVFTRVWVG